jgi:bifunctional DNA-binding transcriptional regulator/antitoxin component of YhaV-PrlF toxin-antitoxin module
LLGGLGADLKPTPGRVLNVGPSHSFGELAEAIDTAFARWDLATTRANQTKVSSKHQVTIPAAAFRSAGFESGDVLKVEAQGAGRVVLTRIDALADEYSGALNTGGGLREQVEGLRDEWR